MRYVAAVSSGEPLDPRWQLTMNFHPDRAAGGVPVLRRMARDGVSYSQFVTGTGNGGLTAHPGGDRHRWESRIFGGAYDHASPHERSVYGALNHRAATAGGAPRFGSSYFRLNASTRTRATFCYPDSSTGPTAFGVADRCALVALADADALDPLDGHVEAQIHGPVLLDRDVDALVLDPSYRGTPVETAAGELPCPVEWHTGFHLTVDRLRRQGDVRDRHIVDLGAAIARDGRLDPRVIGDAVRTARHDPQDLKKVWHCLARFGSPDSVPTRRTRDAPPSVQR
ncbi:DUF3626 domain-containing protein [Streptomyces sp. SL13]|uniref:DUF3626 domain-containing protein n=1 Tax=Streptantibioticus silvisoli TaxID=2705255 RepID=A0AA90GYB0_9ACTN|nr:DUF3626 domain-containing protein [Streptantibioticus silvisoli]MDI5967801.1 DUF3626 domain-containing protein [Streptantibioticus silvisoli]